MTTHLADHVEPAHSPAPETQAVRTDAPGHAPGDMISPGYLVLEHLFRSRSLDVYAAWSLDRGARVIAKRVRPDRVDVARGDRVREEGRLLLGLAHPHLVRAYEVAETGGADPEPVLITEMLTGMTLEHLIHDRAGRLPWPDLCLLGSQVASAIRYLHSTGYLHMDLKPSNIVVADGVVKVIDLSLARRPGSRGDVGTHDYQSPESARNEPSDVACDVWGIGCVLWEAAVGEPAFASQDGTTYEQLQRRAAPVRTRRRLQPTIAGVIDACLEPNAADRPAVAEIHDTLAAVVGEPMLTGRVADRPVSVFGTPRAASTTRSPVAA